MNSRLRSSLTSLAFYRRLTIFLGRMRHRILRRLIRINLSQDVTFLLLGVVVGIASGYGAVIYHEAIRMVQEFLYGTLYGAMKPWHPYAIMILPALGGLAVGIYLQFFSREARGHGVPDVIKAVIARGGYIRPSLMFSKVFTSAFSIGSGGGAGREGPIVQIGAAIGSGVGQLFKLSDDQLRTLVAAGTAAGIAAIFNAPLGGVMFALEVIAGDFNLRMFTPIVVAAVLATAISRSILGDYPTFVSTHYTLVSPSELFFYLILGILAGFVSVGYSRVVFAVEGWTDRKLRLPRLLSPAVGGLMVGVMLIWFPGLAGYSYEPNNTAILGRGDPLHMAFLMVLTPVAAGLTLGTGGSGGLFAPALKSGAMFGALAGLGLHWAFPTFTASSGAYALVGMGAVLAGTMHAPLTAMTVIFEVSNTYQVILPIMFAAVSATVIARLLQRESIYTLPLVREGLEIGYGINLSIVHQITVAGLMHRDVIRVSRSTSLRKVLRLLETQEQTVLPVIDADGRLLGIVRFQDIYPVLGSPELYDVLMVDDVMIGTPATVTPSTSLGTLLKTFELSNVDMLPVVSHDGDRALLGMVRQDEALRRYRKEVLFRAEK